MVWCPPSPYPRPAKLLRRRAVVRQSPPKGPTQPNIYTTANPSSIYLTSCTRHTPPTQHHQPPLSLSRPLPLPFRPHLPLSAVRTRHPPPGHLHLHTGIRRAPVAYCAAFQGENTGSSNPARNGRASKRDRTWSVEVRLKSVGACSCFFCVESEYY